MQVNLQYITTVKDATGKPTETVYLKENGTGRDLIAKLISIYGPRLRSVIYPHGGEKVEIQVSILVGAGFQPLEPLETELKEGDTILMGTVLPFG